MNHVALVCSDMAATVAFYEGVLGFPLFKTIEMPGGGQHFFDIGNGASLAFMWFPDAEPAAPGIASQHPTHFRSAVGSMNHVAIDVPLERIDEYHRKLLALGLETHLINHDDSPCGASQGASRHLDPLALLLGSRRHPAGVRRLLPGDDPPTSPTSRWTRPAGTAT